MLLMLYQKRLPKEALAIDEQGNARPGETSQQGLRLYEVMALAQNKLNRLVK